MLWVRRGTGGHSRGETRSRAASLGLVEGRTFCVIGQLSHPTTTIMCVSCSRALYLSRLCQRRSSREDRQRRTRAPCSHQTETSMYTQETGKPRTLLTATQHTHSARRAWTGGRRRIVCSTSMRPTSEESTTSRYAGVDDSKRMSFLLHFVALL